MPDKAVETGSLPDKAVETGNLPDNLINQGVDLMEIALGEKLQAITKDSNILRQVYQLLIQSGNFLYIEQDGELQGLLQYFTHDTKSKVTLNSLFKIMGVLKGVTAYIKLIMACHIVKINEIHIKFIAVPSHCRGKGIGTKLIEYLIIYANDNQLNTLSLEVIDSNKKAVKLYEKLGFKKVETSAKHPLDDLYKSNFNEVYLMEKRNDGENVAIFSQEV